MPIGLVLSTECCRRNFKETEGYVFSSSLFAESAGLRDEIMIWRRI
jgi:hypothetical protein